MRHLLKLGAASLLIGALLLPHVVLAVLGFNPDTGGTLTTGLVEFYNLEDATGDFASFDLTNNGTVTFAAGKINNAANFEAASNQHLTVANNLGITSGAFTYAFCVKPDTQPSTNTDHQIVMHGESTGFTEVYIGYHDVGGTKQVSFSRQKNGGSYSRSFIQENQTLTTGTWYSIIATYDTTNMKLFVNGSQLGADTAASGTGTENSPDSFTIGAFKRGAIVQNYFDGMVDVVGAWSKALDATEISDIANSGNCNAYGEVAAAASGPNMQVVWID